MTSVLTWSLLGAAVAAAAGAVAALVRYRRRAATNVDSETPDGALTETATDAASTPTGQTSAVPTQAAPKPAEPAVPGRNRPEGEPERIGEPDRDRH